MSQAHLLVTLLALLPFWGCRAGQTEAPRNEGELHAARTSHAVSGLPATAAEWRRARELVVPLVPQDLVEPKLTTAGVAELRVSAVHDGQSVAFRLEWTDATRDVVQGPGQFSDAAAVQLPGDARPDPADPAMGTKGRPVHVVYWRAAWQETADPVVALRPNMAIDHYPFQAARPEARTALATQYAPARGAGNPLTVRPAGRAVQDLVAEGAGTMTIAEEQLSSGSGVFRANTWTVTLISRVGAGQLHSTVPERPLDRRSYAAFAIWDGSARHAGARKMRSLWVPVSFEVSQ